MESKEQKAGDSKPDLIFRYLTGGSAVTIILVMIAIFYVLLTNSIPSMQEFGWRFLFDRTWDASETGANAQTYGALTSIYGTVATTILAMLIGAPVGLIIAIFLVELSHPFVARIVGAAIELLAAIPSIVYGLWGALILVPIMQGTVQPWLKDIFGDLPILKILFEGPPMGFGILTAGIILALMILPFITAVTRDVLYMVPSVLKEAAHGCGATMWEATKQVSMPYAIRGIVGALFLGLGRAIGETMAVTFVIGNTDNISLSLNSTGNSIASKIALELPEALANPLQRSALIELGLILFVITMIFQFIAQVWVNKLKKHERK